MGKKEDLEGEEGQSFLASILAIVITLLLTAVVIMVVYFGLFKNGGGFLNPSVTSDIPMGAAGGSTESEQMLMNPAESVSKPVTEPGEAKPDSMEQNTKGEGTTGELLGVPESGEKDTSDIMEGNVEASITATPMPVNIEEGHNFIEVNEVITAKEATNLRNMPSQGAESQVKMTLYNGQVATRIGISDSGWSKVTYDGEIYYAVSSYLTTDLTPPTPVPEDDGIKTVFTERDEMVAPKIEVNLRTLPSVTNPESVVVVKLPYGTQVRRTGINTDVGWSRVEYEGQVLYCVSSYVFVVEQPAQ